MRIDNQSLPDRGTRLLGDYIREKGIALAPVSEKTGISYGKLLRSLSVGDRALRTDEFLSVCSLLELDPMRFYCQAEAAQSESKKEGR